MNDHDIVEKYESPGVTKFIHVNGMETTLKTVPGCGGEEKNKAVLFISCSVGCEQKCKFCYLTTKQMKFEYVFDDTIVMAIKSVLDEIDITDKYLKLSFMGMGEVFATTYDLHAIVLDIFDYAMSNELIKGIDGVDVGTSVPQGYSDTVIGDMHVINSYLHDLFLSGVEFNPANDYAHRSFVRLFVSLHSVCSSIRFQMMPKTSSMMNLNGFLNRFQEIDIHFHVMLVKGVNDSPLDVIQLLDAFDWYKYKDRELRLLRFNKCDRSVYEESPNFDAFVEEANRRNIKFKYQESAGSEILSACGQFVCKSFTHTRVYSIKELTQHDE